MCAVLSLAFFALVQSHCPSGTQSALMTSIGEYPGGTISISTSSKVWVVGNGPVLHVYYHLEGLPSADTQGGAHVHSGTSCASAGDVGGHYYNNALTNGTDPWSTVWEKDAGTTSATGMFMIYSGYEFVDNHKHTFVIHQQDGTKIGCGVLESTSELLSGLVSPYPDIQLGRRNLQLTYDSQSAVWITPKAGGGLRVYYSLEGLVENGVSGGAHIHSGSSCGHEDLVGDHFWTPSTDADPWNANTMWTKTNMSTTASGFFDVISGYDLSGNDGHTFVIHDAPGRVKCGVLSIAPLGNPCIDIDECAEGLDTCSEVCKNTMGSFSCTAACGAGYASGLHAKIGGYPNGTLGGIVANSLSPSSEAFVSAREDGGLTVYYKLEGLEASETSGGAHIHSGLSCATPDVVGGHYPDSTTTPSDEDPWGATTKWEKAAGATTAVGSFHVAATVVNFAMNQGHTFVVHNEAGGRIGCGVLTGASFLAGSLDVYPGITASVADPSSTVWVTEKADGGLSVYYDLEGLPIADTKGGAHIHSGTECPSEPKNLTASAVYAPADATGSAAAFEDALLMAGWKHLEFDGVGAINLSQHLPFGYFCGDPSFTFSEEFYVGTNDVYFDIGDGLVDYVADLYVLAKSVTEDGVRGLVLHMEAMGSENGNLAFEVTFFENGQMRIVIKEVLNNIFLEESGWLNDSDLSGWGPDSELFADVFPNVSGVLNHPLWHTWCNDPVQNEPKIEGGHFFTTTATDPWNTMWAKANTTDAAHGTFDVASSGYDLPGNDGHAFVLHQQSGARIGCGLLHQPSAVCLDVDECLTGTAACYSNSTCVNTVGSYMCECDFGFVKNGSACIGKADALAKENGVKPSQVATLKVLAKMTKGEACSSDAEIEKTFQEKFKVDFEAYTSDTAAIDADLVKKELNGLECRRRAASFSEATAEFVVYLVFTDEDPEINLAAIAELPYISSVELSDQRAAKVNDSYGEDTYNVWIGVGLGAGFGVVSLAVVCLCAARSRPSKLAVGPEDDAEEP